MGRGHTREAKAQQQVLIGVVGVQQPVLRRDADVDVGMRGLKVCQAGQQPQRCKGREGGHGNLPTRAALAHGAHRAVQLFQQRQHRLLQRQAGFGQLHVARAPVEQRRSQFFFERLDLAADGRLREIELLRCRTEGAQPGHGLEGAQAVQPQGPLMKRLSSAVATG
jgi:hypothetical protein